MTRNVGAPGDDTSRRAFLATTGAAAAAPAGNREQNQRAGAAAQSDVPLPSPLEVADVHEQGVRSR